MAEALQPNRDDGQDWQGDPVVFPTAYANEWSQARDGDTGTSKTAWFRGGSTASEDDYISAIFYRDNDPAGTYITKTVTIRCQHPGTGTGTIHIRLKDGVTTIDSTTVTGVLTTHELTDGDWHATEDLSLVVETDGVSSTSRSVTIHEVVFFGQADQPSVLFIGM